MRVYNSLVVLESDFKYAGGAQAAIRAAVRVGFDVVSGVSLPTCSAPSECAA